MVGIAEILFSLEALGGTPWMMSGAGEMGKEESLVLAKGFIDQIFDVGASLGFGITALRLVSKYRAQTHPITYPK